MGKSAKNLPAVSPHFIASVTDPNLRLLLQPLVDSWNIRNGIRGGSLGTEFIAIEDIENNPELRARLRAALGI